MAENSGCYESAERIVELLKKYGLSVTTVESCTGGLLAASIVDVPGASGVFSRGFITYSNDAKTEVIGVDKTIIDSYGVVSEETALEMVKKGAITAKTECALATTGIAGPSGEDAENPVGTVIIACKISDSYVVKRFVFDGDRKNVRNMAVCEAIRMLRNGLESERNS